MRDKSSFPICRYFPGDIAFYSSKSPGRKDARASEKLLYLLGVEKKPPLMPCYQAFEPVKKYEHLMDSSGFSVQAEHAH